MERFALLVLVLYASSTCYLKAHATCSQVERKITSLDFEASFSDYEPKENSKSLVLIVPPTGGANLIDQSYAKAICKSGIQAVVLNHWANDDEYALELEIHERFYRRAQKAIDLVQTHFSEKEIGILGTSVGAIHSAIAFARNEKIRSAYLIVGGGDIAAIISHSDLPAMVEAKKARFKMFGFKSDEDYELALKKILPFEPLTMNFQRANRKLGMVISTNDLTVPSANQNFLRDAWKPDFTSYSRWNHFWTIVKTWLCDSQDIVRFFAE